MKTTERNILKNAVILAAFFALLQFSVMAQYTHKPVVVFMDKSAHIEQSGRTITGEGWEGITFPEEGKGTPMSGWDATFRKKFNENFRYMVNQLDSELAETRMQGEDGGRVNFEVNLYIFCIHDCEPCSGPEAYSQEYLAVYSEFVDAATRQILHIEKTEAEFTIEGEPNLQESVDRAWSEFLRSYIKTAALRTIIKNITQITDAVITFKPADASEEIPMKADGKKRGWVEIKSINSEKASYPVGENSNNALTEYELSCKNGVLFDMSGQPAQKVRFKGHEFVEMKDDFKIEYEVYNCDEICDKIDLFRLRIVSQNGQNISMDLAEKKEEFACYGYTLNLNFSFTSEAYGEILIDAFWKCFNINFGQEGKSPVTLDMESVYSGNGLLDVEYGAPLLPPFVIPMPEDLEVVHLSGVILDHKPDMVSFSCSGGAYSPEGGISNWYINYEDEYLTDPPDLVWVKKSTPAVDICGGVVSPGVYLTWQFDIWGIIPDFGPQQMFQIEASYCYTNLINAGHDNNKIMGAFLDARVPQSAIDNMKSGKPFEFTIESQGGAVYTITGIPDSY